MPDEHAPSQAEQDSFFAWCYAQLEQLDEDLAELAGNNHNEEHSCS